tara:strand:- start:47 stop:1156 length:1110 start_codon:yes stop_codon:yes gene_type:complete
MDSSNYSLSKLFNMRTAIGDLGIIDPNLFPSAPPCPQKGYRWIDGGKVFMLPIDDWESDYSSDPNSKLEDDTHYSKIESNILTMGFDYGFEPGHGVKTPDNPKVSGKSARTRYKVFLNHGQSHYPVRLMEPIEGYDQRTSSFLESFIADISHRPARSLNEVQIAKSLWYQKQEGVAWYHGQTKNPITGEYVYGKEEYKHAYYEELHINQQYAHKASNTRIWNMIEKGFSTNVKINDVNEKTIKEQIKVTPLGDGKDGFKVAVFCMDDPQANAPTKLWKLITEPNTKFRDIAFTKRADTAEEVMDLRKQLTDTMQTRVGKMIDIVLHDKLISTDAAKEIKERKLKQIFDNYELYSYNHCEDEKELVRLAI